MRMQSPSLVVSSGRSWLGTAIRLRNKPARSLALLALIAVAATALASTSSSAQLLFGKASAMVGLGSTPAPAAIKAAPVNPTLTAPNAPLPPSDIMLVERRGHTATRLSNGSVLIAGGENSSGVLNECEIYDPASATFSVTGNLGAARADHSATLLADGRVLLVGGRSAAGALNTTEIFDPTTGAFASGPAMSVARAGHSATLFADGRIFIAGGDANGSAEIFDPSMGTFSAAGANMNVARSMHSAALLADGRVLLVGGRNASGDALSSGEIFDGSGFSAVESSLKVARVRAHLRVLFDGKVQIIGGSNDGSMEIYDPAIAEFGAYAHVLPESDTCAGLSGQILASQTRAALFYNGQSDPLFDRAGQTITEMNGHALVLGGANSSGAVLSSSSVVGSSSAAITTDKMDYAPGETVAITGRGFQAGETVRLKIHEDPHTPQERGFDAVADADGNFSGEYLVQDYDLDMKFIVGARGLTSGAVAQTTFTDANTFNVTPLNQSVAAGSTNTFVWTFTAQNSANVATTTFTVPAGWTAPQTGAGPGQVTVTAGTCAASLNSIAGQVITINQQSGGCNNNQTFTLTYSNATAPTPVSPPQTYTFTNQHGTSPTVTVTAAATVATTTAVTSSVNPSVFGQSVSFTAIVSRSSGSPSPTGTVQFKVDGVDLGTPVTLSSINATSASATSVATTTLAVGTRVITAVYAPGAGFSASTGTLTGGQVVNKRNTLTTVSSSLNPSTFGESVSFSATVVGTGAGAGNPSGGSVQFKIDGVNFGAPVALAGGSASSGATTTLSAGNHTVEAFFVSSDTNFNDSNDSLDGGQVVNKRNTLTTVSSSLNPSTFGESVSFSATVVGTGAGAGNPSGGSVQFKIDGVNFGAPVALVAGSASSGATTTLTAGNHTVEAFFVSSDTNFNDSNDLLDGGQVVNKRNTLTTVSSSLNPSTFGESVSFSATVVGTGAGAGNPSGGSVQFKIDGVNFGAPVALVAGSASSGATTTLTAGNHTVEAVFTSSDTNFNDSNDLLDGGQVVNKRNTLTTVSSSLNPSTFGESVSFSATVVGTGAGAGNPSGGSVQFKIDGVDFGAPVALVAGSASSGATTTLTAGNHTVEAVFTSSDTNFNDSNDLLDGGQVVNKRNTLTTVSSSLNPSTFGESVSFSATVVGTGAGAGNPSGGSVQFKIDGVDFGAPVALVAGAASSGSTSSLSAGNHTVEAYFVSADTNFNDSNDSLDGGQVVNKRNTLTTVSSSLNPSTFGESVSFSATVVGTGAGAGNPSGGSVQFKIDGVDFGAPVALVAGSASSGATTTLTAGNHTVEAVFTSSDTNFNDSNDLLDGGQQVNQRATLTTVSSSLNPSTFGESVSFSATVVGTGAGAGNPSGGSVQFKIDGVDFGAPVALVAGSASSGATTTLTAGNHTVEAVFTSSDANFSGSNDLLDGGQQVNQRATLTTVSSSLNPSTFGESVSFSATVVGTGAGAGNPSGGSVQFKIDGSNFGAAVPLSGGSASSGSISTLTAGNHTVEAIFTSSDANFSGSNDLLDGGQQVNQRATLTTVSSSLNPSTFGESVSFSATVVGTGAGAGNPSGGSVQFKIDGSNFGAAVPLSGGSASSGSISTLTAGNHTVEAIFTSSDANFSGSNDLLDGGQQVNQRATLTTVSSSLNPSTFGESVSFSATVVGTGAGAGNPSGGSVQFKIDGSNFGAAVPLSGGSASSGSISTLTAGNHTVEAIFTSSDANFSGSNDLLDGGQQVNQRATLTTVSSSLNPSTFGESVSFSATVVGTGAGAGNPSGGSVQFKIDGSNFGAAVPLSGGSASSGSISTLTAGNHTVEAIFTSSDANFSGSNDLLDGGQQVNKADSLSTVTSSVNPSVFGESVTFTATVTAVAPGAGTPSGTVDFKDGATTIATAVVLNGSGVATFPTASLSAGVHSITAVYSGDGNFNATGTGASTAPIFSQTVNQRATLTTVSSSLNPSTFGESVSFSATVVGTGAGAGNPSGGSVQFKIDGSNFGAAVPLSGGSASSGSISTLTAGNHTVEAVFTSSDANFSGSNDLLDGGQQVNQRATLTTVSSSLNPSTFGESVSFSATVVGTGAGAGNPSGGSVQFKIDGSNFGAAVPLSGGSASSGSISTLTAGNHTVEAIFTSSDANFNGSSDPLDGGQTVNKRNTLTTVSSSQNPSIYGASVSFTATVVGTGPGAGNPTGGSVQFKIDAVNFGAPVALVAGSATSGSTTTLSVGNHIVEAVFTSSDTNFNNSSDLLDGGQTVGAWTLTGFYQPVGIPNTYHLLIPPMSGITWNSIKGGQTVPLKFNVFAGTVEQTLVSAIAGFTVQEVACIDVNTLVDDIDFVTTGATQLRYDGTPGSGGQFIQNWKTPNTANKCYRTVMTTSDSSVLVAFFKTKK